ncbi:flavodoxin family protein [Acidaminobacter sp. JC074]|uniref:flavodoxin family protein n=1 Tax=Acidaminobacter sp. JC074 TaxID=2530199 RepID=UPI001F0DD946|nr:flavodoxin family protein [Acidaminobacter sp. JC074]MCH4889538.1 flavodoxin family protein [Acidaminobacter sp. JC074]
MKKILVLSGSPRKNGHTMKFVNEIESNMNQFDFEYLHVYDLDIKPCIGCKACIKKDEMACPFKSDDVLPILEKLERADGLIFTSPTYSRTVSGQLKNFIDRTNFSLHRPRLINIPMIAVSTTDILMADKVASYLGVIGSSMGANVIGGLGVKIGKYHNDSNYKAKVEKTVPKMSHDFMMAVENPNRKPSMKQLLRFTLWKTRAVIGKDISPNDYQYWHDKGWIEKDFFTDVSIPFPKKLVVKIASKRLSKLIQTGILYKD